MQICIPWIFNPNTRASGRQSSGERPQGKANGATPLHMGQVWWTFIWQWSTFPGSLRWAYVIFRYHEHVLFTQDAAFRHKGIPGFPTVIYRQNKNTWNRYFTIISLPTHFHFNETILKQLNEWSTTHREIAHSNNLKLAKRIVWG